MFTTEQIKKFIADGRTDIFYNSRSWRRKTKEIKAAQNNECQFCKARGRVGPADLVHHVKRLKQFPELAYAEYYTDEQGQRQRQLVAVCYKCHNIEHCGEDNTFKQKAKAKEHYTNGEQW